MTELEKLEAGLEYCYDDAEVSAQVNFSIMAHATITAYSIGTE